jgi:2-amino-4-hydroxy-6-hydroxymethyldihydropteridine diphosphokinase
MEFGLSLGSNLGDRTGQLTRARAGIEHFPRTRVVAASPVYETEPVGVKAEYGHLKFLNAVLVIESGLDPDTLRREVAALEARLGRVRGPDRFAPRAIDIDILYAGDVLMETEGLTLPHPRWATRRFVVQPLADVRPDLVLPGARRTVRDILAALPSGEAVTLFSREWEAND